MSDRKSGRIEDVVFGGLMGMAIFACGLLMGWASMANVAARSYQAGITKGIESRPAAPAPPGDDGATPRLFGAARYPQPGDPLPNGEMYEITSYTLYDLDTLDDVVIDLPWNAMTGPWRLRLTRVDGLEVSRSRRTVGEITDDEIRRGKAAAEELRAFLGGKRLYVQVDGSEWSAYGRIAGMLWAEPEGGGERIDVATWIRGKGWDRGDTD